jgi:hypothetical protein
VRGGLSGLDEVIPFVSGFDLDNVGIYGLVSVVIVNLEKSWVGPLDGENSGGHTLFERVITLANCDGFLIAGSDISGIDK